MGCGMTDLRAAGRSILQEGIFLKSFPKTFGFSYLFPLQMRHLKCLEVQRGRAVHRPTPTQADPPEFWLYSGDSWQDSPVGIWTYPDDSVQLLSGAAASSLLWCLPNTTSACRSPHQKNLTTSLLIHPIQIGQQRVCQDTVGNLALQIPCHNLHMRHKQPVK
jgi:hypothetical protein